MPTTPFIKIGCLIYPRVQPMDVIGPWEVFASWKNILGGNIELTLVAESLESLEAANAIKLQPHCDFSTAPQFDVLLIPGGPGRVEQSSNQKLLDFVHQQAGQSNYLLSICTGIFLLNAANLLENQKVTTYWRAMDELRSMTNAKVVEERLVKSGKLWSAGGISSGIDLAFAFIEEISGSETAGQVQLIFEYFPNQTIFCNEETNLSLPLYFQENTPKKLPDYIRRIIKNCSSSNDS